MPECEMATPRFAVVDDFDSNAALNQVVEKFPATEFKLFLYQTRQEFADATSLLQMVESFDQVSNGRIEISELLESPGGTQWRDEYYADSIHPTVDRCRSSCERAPWFYRK